MAINWFDIYTESPLNSLAINSIGDSDMSAELLDDLVISTPDDEILEIVKKWKGAASDLRESLIQVGNRNYRYYIGDFTKYAFRDYIKTIDNRIFVSLETIVPIATSKPAQPVVYPGTTSDESKELANMHQKVLLTLFKNLEVQKIEEALVRHNQFYRLGVLKYGIKDGKIHTNYVLPTKLYIDPNAKNQEDCQFVGEIVEVTAKDLIEYFPSKKSIIETECQGKLLTNMKVIEWWSPNFVVITLNEKYVLKKIKNPHFDYKGSKNKENEFENYILEDYRYNYFSKPKVPYIFMQVFNSGLSLIDDTTPLEQCIPLQDQINKLLYQLQDNIEIVGNPILKAQGFTREQIDQLNRRKVGDAVGIAQDQELDYLQPAAVPQYIIQQITFLQNQIDDLMGTHPTTRGEREAQETLGGRELLRQGDEDRQAVIGRSIERVLRELYKAWTHLIKVYYDEEQLMPDLTAKGAQEYLTISRDNIEDGIEIYVTAGSTLPDDKVSRRKEAMDLWAQQAITIEELYERLGWENPAEQAIKFKLDGLETQLINTNAQQVIQAYQDQGEMIKPKELAHIIMGQGLGDGGGTTEQPPTTSQSETTNSPGLSESNPVGSAAVSSNQP